MCHQRMYDLIDDMVKDPVNTMLKSKDESGGLVLALITPLLKRILESVELRSSFLWIRRRFDLTNISVTLILTHHPIRGLPIGILLTESQLASAYKEGIII
jgi:hypothetical protein